MGDIALALRILRHRPQHSLGVILVVALGVGVNTALFSVVHAALLKPLPYRQEERLAMLWLQEKSSATPDRTLATPGDLLEWRRRAASFTDIAGVEVCEQTPSACADLVGDGRAERLRAARVTPNFFSVLGTAPEHGRVFSADSVQRGEVDVVVLSGALWRRRFGADRSFVERTILLNVGVGTRDVRRFTVIGVMPDTFRFTYPMGMEIWWPLPWDTVQAAPRVKLSYQVIGRLHGSASFETAQREMTALSDAVAREFPAEQFRIDRTVRLEPVRVYALGNTAPAVVVLASIAGLLLLATYLTSTLIVASRLIQRQPDLHVRAWLGASDIRLWIHVATEPVVATLIGGTLGIGFMLLGQPIMKATLVERVPRGDEAGLSIPVAIMGMGVAILISALGSLALWWRLHHLTRRDATRTPVPNQHRPGILMIQIAVSTVLLLGAAQLLQSWLKLRELPLGFNGRGVLTLKLVLLDQEYQDPEHLREFQRQLLERARAIPGVLDASLISSLPLRDWDNTWRLNRRGGASADGPLQSISVRHVDWRYFALMSIPLKAGRSFNEADAQGAPPVAVVSETLAKTFWPEDTPVGKRMKLSLGALTEVVGVVGDVRHVSGPDLPRGAVYLPSSQVPSGQISLLVRVSTDTRQVAVAAHKAIGAIDPLQPVERVETYDAILSDIVAEQRFRAFTVLAFSLLALLLAATAVYAILARSVAGRQREIGVRIVCGADNRHLMRMILAEGLQPVVLGMILGFVASVWLSLALQHVFPDTPFPRPWVCVLVCAWVLVVALCACYLPARKATHVTPANLLKAE